MVSDLLHTLRHIHTVVAAARHDTARPDELLDALTALRELRDELARWEPELINAARTTGASWATLAPALGVASRQAAERRFLRLQPSTTGESTAEGRVDAERDRRAADKAVAAWARRHATTLRQLAGQVSTLDDLGDAGGQASATALGAALGTNDPADLLTPLAATHPHLTGPHPGIANQVTEITDQTDEVRRNAINTRRHPNNEQR
jgi:hypothetical protein